MSKPYDASNPFLPYDESHRADWPEYKQYVEEKLGEVQSALIDWKAANGPVPMKLRASAQTSQHGTTFTPFLDGKAGGVDDLEELADQTRQYNYVGDPLLMASNVSAELTALGVDIQAVDDVATISDLMEQYEAHLVTREIFQFSDIEETLQSMNIAYQSEQFRDEFQIIVADPQQAKYLQLTYG